MAEETRAGRYFLQNVPLDQALARWRSDRSAQESDTRVGTEIVAIEQAAGRIVGEAIWAKRSSPAYDGAAMDGIALRAAHTLEASESTPVFIERADYEHVDTGDPLPQQFDAVVMREHVHFDPQDRAELRAPVAPFQHVRSLGEDIAETELLLAPGHLLRPIDVACVAAAGNAEVSVSQRPRVAIIPTGDELKPVGSTLETGEIADTNSLMLAGQTTDAGGMATIAEIVPDDPARLRATLAESCAAADVVLLIAGSSAGRDDHSANVIGADGVLSAHGIAVKPGHPVVLGVVAATPVVGIPGYPVSAALTFDSIVAPLLAELQGTTPSRRPRTKATLARKLPSAIGVNDCVRVRLGRINESLVAVPQSGGAGVLSSLVHADGLLQIGPEREGHDAGDEIVVELLRSLEAIESTIVFTGSHDLVLDVAAAELRTRNPENTLTSSAVGSLGGLTALRDGLCHIAGAHLLDEATGTYNLPFVERIFADRDVAVVRLTHRDQGLIVQPDNPLTIASLEDLTRREVRYVNRQRGAGTRVLLDYELAQREISPDAINGYGREEYSHLALAAAISGETADCGMGILAAARAFNLGFIPITSEPFDLVLATSSLEDPTLAPFLALLSDTTFRQAVMDLGGYDVREMGRRLL